MKIIEFNAEWPKQEEALALVRQTIELFNKVRAQMIHAPELATIDDIHAMVEEVGADKFMVEDIISVRGGVAPAISEWIERGFWTLGRHHPRFGIPWGGFTFDEEHDEAALLVRCGGTFDDEEDPPLWVSCRLTNLTRADIESMSRSTFEAHTLDLWLLPNAENIAGQLLAR